MKNSRNELKKTKLAIEGGPRSIKLPMPARNSFGPMEKQAINDVIAYYERMGVDPGYQGHFQKLFCESFNEFMGGGYSTAVATGTGAIFVALAALELPKESEIILSPITDPGTLNAIVMQGFKVSLADAISNDFNTNWEAIKQVITDRTSAIMVVHCGGISVDIDKIVAKAHELDIRVIEDCSQAPGATHSGRCVGTFGDVAALSTMYRKSIASGGSGGLVYTSKEKIYHKILSHADRGKMLWNEEYEERNAERYLFPALNWNTDEFSCAIGEASLKRLEDTISSRCAFVNTMTNLINTHLVTCKAADFIEGSSPFFLRVHLNISLLKTDKITFCRALLAEGVDLNPHYRFVISEWEWAQTYLSEHRETPNAIAARDNSFNLYLNENYTGQTAQAILDALKKVEKHYINYVFKL